MAAIGHQDQANHQYDLTDFWAAGRTRRARLRAVAQRRQRVPRDRSPILHELIGPKEEGVGDLLSYVFLDPDYIEDTIQLGAQHAAHAISRPRPWTTTQRS